MAEATLYLFLTLLALTILTSTSLKVVPRTLRQLSIMQTTGSSMSSTGCYAGPKPIHSKFTVEKASDEKLKELDVASWPLWSTNDSTKYLVGKKSPKKVYDCNELSYIVSGKVQIISEESGETILVQAGDFVTFPDGFSCYWFVVEPVLKHWRDDFPKEPGGLINNRRL